MVAGRHKSGRFRRVFRKVPGGRLVTQFKETMPKQAKCGNCGKHLPGIPRLRPAKFRNLPKSQKTIARPYGGNLCSKCARATIVASVSE